MNYKIPAMVRSSFKNFILKQKILFVLLLMTGYQEKPFPTRGITERRRQKNQFK